MHCPAATNRLCRPGDVPGKGRKTRTVSSHPDPEAATKDDNTDSVLIESLQFQRIRREVNFMIALPRRSLYLVSLVLGFR